MMTAPKVTSETDSIELIPEWDKTLEWMAENMAQHGFLVNSYTAMAGILDIARYLARGNDESAALLDRIIDNLTERGNR